MLLGLIEAEVLLFPKSQLYVLISPEELVDVKLTALLAQLFCELNSMSGAVEFCIEIDFTLADVTPELTTESEMA